MPEYPGGKITHHRVYKHIIYAMYVHDSFQIPHIPKKKLNINERIQACQKLRNYYLYWMFGIFLQK